MVPAMTNCDLGVWFSPESLTSSEMLSFARRVEELGYRRLWVGETFGRDPFAQLAAMGSATTALGMASGIANIYHRHPGVMLMGANTLAEQTGGRFTLGLGVSSPVIVSKVRGLDYDKPLAFLRSYLDAMAEANYTSVPPEAPVPVVLAALGPRMLELAAERTAGAHPYNTTPEHTAFAREVMGPDAGLFVEQKVMLTTDPAQARATGAKVLRFYSRAPGYVNAWKRLGFSDDDIATQSPRLVDALVAWGTVERIRDRLKAHADAGATEVCIHPLDPESGQKNPDSEALEALAAPQGVIR